MKQPHSVQIPEPRTMAERKRGHIEAVLSGRTQARTDAGFTALRFEPCALPELDLDAINLSTCFLGKQLKLPFLISSMTGGQSGAERINVSLAEAAQTLGIALGVGSQRIALAQGGLAGIDRSLRRRAPDIALYGNIGAAQLRRDYNSADLMRALEMIEADALIVHLNPLQEALQEAGDTCWSGLLNKLERLCAELPLPVIVKEVGFGISAPVALRLASCGVAAIDVAGSGGTSWSAVEGAMSDDPKRAALAELFRDWGIPTATALREVRAALPALPMIGSGGIRSGLDAAKAIRLGADIVGQAGGLLHAAVRGTEAVLSHFAQLEATLRLVCFATGARDLAALKLVRLL